MGLGHWRGGGGKWSSGCDLGLRGGEERKHSGDVEVPELRPGGLLAAGLWALPQHALCFPLSWYSSARGRQLLMCSW